MTLARRLRFADELEADEAGPVTHDDEAPAAEPQVFVRTVAAPPGWPWEQRRNVDLEARYGAPLPIADLVYRVRRLEPWRPGAGSRFAVFYVLAREVKGALEASAEVDGRTLSVSFGRNAAAGLRAGRTLVRTLGVCGVSVLVVWSTLTALQRRSETRAALELVEQRAAGRLRAAETRARVAEQGRLLDLQLDRGTPLVAVLADLAWASNAKAPQVRLDAVHWRRGVIAVEARGEDPPFGTVSDRRVERAPREVRPGVILWGVKTADLGGGSPPPDGNLRP